MSRGSRRTPRIPDSGPTPAVLPWLVPVGVVASLALPFLVLSTASSEAIRESKLLVQGLGASVALIGLSRVDGLRVTPPAIRAARLATFSLLLALALALLSAFANARIVDPLTAAAVLPPLSLVLIGFSRADGRVARAAALALTAAGAFTGALAALQRWGGVLRLPLEATEPRFFAGALIGNAGDVAMALVVPTVLLFATAADDGAAPRARLAASAGLGLAVLGLVATESVGPLLAAGAGAAAFVALDIRRRRVALFALLAAALAVLASGAGRRLLAKAEQIRRGEIAAASTQRDIGFYAATEMIHGRPLLGVGPGAFSNRFVPARLAAEERSRHRFVHWSGSAHFDNAHSDPVTLASEVGLPAALAAVLSALALLASLIACRRASPGPLAPVSTDALFAALLAFALLGLADFPLRIAVASGPAAFLAGVALRRGERGVPDPARSEGRRRPGVARVALLAAALVTFGLVSIRAIAAFTQAAGERFLEDAASAPSEAFTEREELLSAADARLGRAVSLRPRSATALLALGSVAALSGDRERAYALYARSVALEERAESDLNLGRAAESLGRPDEALLLFTRAVWILPRLGDALPPDARGPVSSAIAGAGRDLAAGGHVPPAPAPR